MNIIRRKESMKMGDYYNSIPLKRIGATILAAFGTNVPEQFAPPLDWLLESVGGKGVFDRVVMYHADAVPMYLWQKYTEEIFLPVMKKTRIAVPFLSTVESVTPVAHGSMYTGLDPEAQGITTYVRPMLRCKTVYDALLREGKRSAIIAMEDSSFLHIFAGRDMEYYSVSSCHEALRKAGELIKKDVYDLISIHTFEYDNAAHHFGPEAPEALNAAIEEAKCFSQLIDGIVESWKEHNTFFGYLPDHGQHAYEENGRMRGSHGSMMTEDMNIVHFYGSLLRL